MKSQAAQLSQHKGEMFQRSQAMAQELGRAQQELQQAEQVAQAKDLRYARAESEMEGLRQLLQEQEARAHALAVEGAELKAHQSSSQALFSESKQSDEELRSKLLASYSELGAQRAEHAQLQQALGAEREALARERDQVRAAAASEAP